MNCLFAAVGNNKAIFRLAVPDATGAADQTRCTSSTKVAVCRLNCIRTHSL